MGKLLAPLLLLMAAALVWAAWPVSDVSDRPPDRAEKTAPRAVEQPSADEASRSGAMPHTATPTFPPLDDLDLNPKPMGELLDALTALAEGSPDLAEL